MYHLYFGVIRCNICGEKSCYHSGFVVCFWTNFGRDIRVNLIEVAFGNHILNS